MDSNMRPPIILGDGAPGKKIGNIIKIIKLFIKLFKKPSTEVGDMEYSDSVESVDRIIKVFDDFKEEVHKHASSVERAVEEEVKYYIEELHDILDNNEEIVNKYSIHINRIEKQMDKILSQLNGVIDNEISKKVTLNNPECMSVIKMIPGEKKEAAMKEFIDHTVKEALDKCCEQLHSCLDEIFEAVELEVFGAVDSVQKLSEKLSNTLSTIDGDHYLEKAKCQMVEAQYTNYVCDFVLEIL